MNNNVNSNTSSTASLFEGKVFTSWNLYDSFLNDWGKNKGFGVIKTESLKREVLSGKGPIFANMVKNTLQSLTKTLVPRSYHVHGI